MEPVVRVPFEGSYWVEPGRLLAGCYPGASRLDEAGRILKALLDAGIRTFINLTEEGETDWWGEGFGPYEESIRILAKVRGSRWIICTSLFRTGVLLRPSS